MTDMPNPVPVDGGLSFGVMVDGQRVAMRISDEALQDHFGARGGTSGLIQAYMANAGRINAKAIDRFRANGGQPVYLKTADFP